MKKNACLLGLLLLLIISLLIIEATGAPVQKETAPEMLAATARTRAAFEAVKAERIRQGYPPDPADDPNETGMIGLSYTEITTTLGNLEAKRSTTNPNVAAMLVDMFASLGIGAGDHVAVNLSGSFPALNIAALCAMDALGIEGHVLFSVGASTHGATIPSLTYGDMEHLLSAQGLIGQRSIGFSMGGEGDLGLEMPQDLHADIVSRLSGYGYAHLAYPDIHENIDARYALYQRDADAPIRCFVNVGGNLVSFGPESGMHTVPGGILTALPGGESGDGLVQRFLTEDVPVIQLLNMKGLLPIYGLPIDPVPLPADGEGGVYWRTGHSKPLLYSLILINLAALVLASRRFNR